MIQGDTAECGRLLDEIDASLKAANDGVRQGARKAQLTRTEMLAREGKIESALVHAESVLRLAAQTGDHYVDRVGRLAKAELLQRNGNIGACLGILSDVIQSISDQPDLFAQYERVLACALAASGDVDTAQSHYDRSKRLLTGLRHAPGLLELERRWNETSNSPSNAARHATPPAVDQGTAATRRTIADMAALMLYGGRPELVARNLVELLGAADCAYAVTASVRVADGTVDVLTQIAAHDVPAGGEGRERRLAIGSIGDRSVEIVLHPKADVESIATINALELLLSMLHDRERARAEREERATLWPIDELPTEDGRAVATGHMRELLSLAQRVARTNVGVLISGESGTGKEILARAVHTHSDRAERPFIPFNCAAVPRELLESQLFGHRRGAFTGADRDNPGVIQSAKGGTLFLDEIGDLSLDLQPKLLRFLESGEICPVGEATPFTVDVRIVAATNANLDALVRDARFREDLFYRLNVVRLSIRPLRERRDEIPGLAAHFVARAADEFRKGPMRIADETMEQLLLYAWPGNVRQLQNELRRMVALAEPHSILVHADISPDILKVTPAPTSLAVATGAALTIPKTDKLLPTIARIEREMIKAALRDNHGKVDAVARALGISRKGLYLKRRRFGL